MEEESKRNGGENCKLCLTMFQALEVKTAGLTWPKEKDTEMEGNQSADFVESCWNSFHKLLSYSLQSCCTHQDVLTVLCTNLHRIAWDTTAKRCWVWIQPQCIIICSTERCDLTGIFQLRSLGDSLPFLSKACQWAAACAAKLWYLVHLLLNWFI